jgi:hypothetical protein
VDTGPPPVAGSALGVGGSCGPGVGAPTLGGGIGAVSKSIGTTVARGEAVGVGTIVYSGSGGGGVGGGTLLVGVGDGVGLGVGEGVGLGVGDGVGLGVGDGVGLGVGDGVGLGVGDGVGLGGRSIEMEPPLGAQSVGASGEPRIIARLKSPCPSRAYGMRTANDVGSNTIGTTTGPGVRPATPSETP